jgi:hypothetical protein
MERDTLIKLYNLERFYQEQAFGDYRNNDSLNLASFIAFLEVTLRKAKESYVEHWTPNLPEWLEACTENSQQGTAPVKTYEYLIKIMALAGAALETYTVINPDVWRREGVKDKWKEDTK